MKLSIEIPDYIERLIHNEKDEQYLIDLIRKSIDDYANTTPRLKKNERILAFKIMQDLVESPMEVEK